MTGSPSPADERAIPPARALRKIFLLLFLRGRAFRGLNAKRAHGSVGTKLGLMLGVYVVFGALCLTLVHEPVFVMAAYLHGLTFVMVGLFVAGSAGEVLFNRDEADIFGHRPIAPRTLLWARVSVMVQVALWLTAALNLVGLVGGMFAADGQRYFPLVHAAALVADTLFCIGTIVVGYQLCLRWFGRERLDGVITAVQIVVSLSIVLAGQIIPRFLTRYREHFHFTSETWWGWLLPPIWFGGIDDALAGSGARASWILAGLAVLGTGAVLGLAFGVLAGDYQAGVQQLTEMVGMQARSRRRSWLDWLVEHPPLGWWLRDSVSRASFRLTAAYLARDRDMKLRVYPALAPMLIMPIALMLPTRGANAASAFMVGFAGSYLGIAPLLGIDLISYSQNWTAAELFRIAPIVGPAPLAHGARRAVLCFLALPTVALFGAIAWFVSRDHTQIALLLPGLMAAPVFALVACRSGRGVPLSRAPEEAGSANRLLVMFGVMIPSFALAGLAAWAWRHGWFGWLLGMEAVVAAAIYLALRASLASVRWAPEA